MDLSNLPSGFEKKTTRDGKRETWCPSTSVAASSRESKDRTAVCDLNELKSFSSVVLPFDKSDSHALMVEKENRLQNLVETLESALNEKQDKNNELENLLVKTKEDAAIELENAINKAGEEFCDMEDSLTSVIDEYKTSVEQQKAKISTLEENVSTLSTEKSQVLDNLEALLNENKELKTSIESLQSTIATLNSENSTLVENISNLKENMQVVTNDLESTSIKSAETEASLLMKIDELEASTLESDEKCKLKISEMQIKIDELASSFFNMQVEKDNLALELSNNFNKSESDLNEKLAESSSKVM